MFIQVKLYPTGRENDVNAKKFPLLEAFMCAKGRVLARNMLLEKVWDMNFDPTTSVVKTHIGQSRGKIEKPFCDVVIRTICAAGYIFEPAS